MSFIKKKFSFYTTGVSTEKIRHFTQLSRLMMWDAKSSLSFVLRNKKYFEKKAKVFISIKQCFPIKLTYKQRNVKVGATGRKGAENF